MDQQPTRSSLNQQYPGNSEKERQRKYVDPVVKKPAEEKKHSPTSTAFVALFGRSFDAIVKSFMEDSLKPYFLSFLYNIGLGFLDEWMNGRVTNSPTRRDQQFERTSLTSSNGMSQDRNAFATSYGYDLENVTYGSKEEADKVLSIMRSELDKFPTVPVSVFLSASAYKTEYTDEDWGWTRQDFISVRPCPAGGGRFYINVPPPRSLK